MCRLRDFRTGSVCCCEESGRSVGKITAMIGIYLAGCSLELKQLILSMMIALGDEHRHSQGRGLPGVRLL